MTSRETSFKAYKIYPGASLPGPHQCFALDPPPAANSVNCAPNLDTRVRPWNPYIHFFLAELGFAIHDASLYIMLYIWATSGKCTMNF